MPTYEYQCQACKKKFAVVQTISEYGRKKVECPKCQSKRVKRLVSPFMVKTSRPPVYN